MRLGQPLSNLRCDFNCFSYWQQPGDEQLAQRLSLYQLHRNVVSGAVLPEFVDGNDIGMIEGGCRAGFPLEAVHAVTVCREFGGKNFERNMATQTHILRPV